MPLVASTDAVIFYLVGAYRAALEDDGDLVAFEFEDSVNKAGSASYDPDSDVISVNCDLAKLMEVLPASQQNLFKSE
jgi:hypothetical protein